MKLTTSQRFESDALLKKYQTVVKVGGEGTTFIEDHINTVKTGKSPPPPPVSVPSYRMNSGKKVLLKKKFGSLLEQSTIEE